MKIANKILLGYLIGALFLIFLLDEHSFSANSIGNFVAIVLALIVSFLFILELLTGKGSDNTEADPKRRQKRLLGCILFSPIFVFGSWFLSIRGPVNAISYTIETQTVQQAYAYPTGRPYGKRKYLKCNTNTFIEVRNETFYGHSCITRNQFNEVKESQGSYGSWVPIRVNTRVSILGTRMQSILLEKFNKHGQQDAANSAAPLL